MTFDKAAATALISAVKSHAESLALFGRKVITHAPLSTPGEGLSCYIELGPVVPTVSSGLAAVSIEVTLSVHILASLNQKPLDAVEAQVLGATSVLLNAYAGAFTLGGLVREVDIFGGMKAEPGYLLFEGKPFRIVTITLPMTVNDAWQEAP
ncbi:MAG TPA: hypothetical protein VGS19_27300 [Streptosporangiaceae bacterium]|nr:hypothetical protein [Streptosporangiaceae bacterium]